jgi:hypothetical protein
VEDLSWNSPSLTIVLASLHAFLYLSSLLLTLRPAFTLFHIFLATQTVAFVLRPILSVADGGFSLYGGPLAFYNEGLFLNLLANFLAALGYLAVYARRYPKASQPYRYSRSSLLKGTWISFALGLTALALIHFLSGGAWLPNARGEAITRVVPFGKVLFPLAVVPFSFSLASSILLILFMLREAKSPLPKNFISLLFLLLVGVTSAVSLILLYQRGFLLTALLVTLFFVARLQNWGYTKLMLIGLLSLVLLTQIRPTAQLIANLLSGEVPSAPANIEEQASFLKRNFLYAPNFDTVDVWPIVLSYIADNGYKGGSTYLAVPLRFFPPSLRLQYGSLTAVDELNVYYWGNVYWEKSFGFGVSLAQEAYLNFGLLGFILPLLAGMLGAWLDRWLWTLSLLTTTRMYGVFAAFHTGIPTSEVGGVVQWALAYLFTGFFIGVLSSLSLKSSANRKCEQR